MCDKFLNIPLLHPIAYGHIVNLAIFHFKICYVPNSSIFDINGGNFVLVKVVISKSCSLEISLTVELIFR